MWQFSLLIMVYFIFIYFFERRARHFVQVRRMSPFDEITISSMRRISTSIFKDENLWSNIILVFGSLITLGLLIIGIVYYRNNYSGILSGISIWVSFLTISISASFSGQTWVKQLDEWISSISDNLILKIIKRLTFELLSIASLVVPFMIFISITLLIYANGSNSPVRIRLLFYFLPIFFVLWIYRIGDYDKFQMNIRRLIVYIVVAFLYLINKDPLSQFITQPVKIPNNFDFFSVFTDFGVLAFITLDRIGKVATEVFSRDKIEEPLK